MKKIAFFGTSHTYGNCTDVELNRIDHAWPEQVAERLDVDHLNFGMPGAPNIEIQILLTEAINNGLLDDVDTIILEPRLTHDWILWDNYNLEHEGTQPFYARSKAGHEEFGISESKRKSAHNKYVQEVGLYQINNTRDYELKMGKSINRLMLNKFRHSLETISYYNWNTIGLLYQSYQYLRTWKTMCESIDKKFYWINWEAFFSRTNRYKQSKGHENLDNDFKDIKSCCINTDMSVADYMTTKSISENKNYLCGCKHFNVEAQKHIAEFIIEKLTTR